MIPINLKSSTPLWEQIKNGLKNQILLGVWSPGEQLPSVRSLAGELGINPNTIQRAYSELEREGLTFTVSGRGCFVEENIEVIALKRKSEALEKLSLAVDDSLKAGITKEELLKHIEKLYGKEEKNDKN